jgi:predicted GNAT family acetyltransferase
MTGHPLDRPVWASLTTRHRAFAEGEAGAKRYQPSIVPFAASRDDSPDNLRDLGALVGTGETVMLLQKGEIHLPATLQAVVQATGVQMIADREMEAFEDERIEQLTPADATEMLALATLTKPGPFTARALAIGRFWGIREDGRLVAMAGQRMAQPGFVELSGVCSHPDVRGRDLGRLLSRYAAGRIREGGDWPYLHAYASNVAAIRLYESIGFVLRAEMFGAVVARAA